MRAILLISFLFFAAQVFAGELTEEKIKELEKIQSPRIEGETLFIKGRIDSHIYDYLAREAKRIEQVRVIELNSLGGNTNWALEAAKKIKGLNKITRVSKDSFCASACTYLFAAGIEREAALDTWFGIHGARLGAGYITTFQGLCFVELEEGTVFEPKRKGCQAFLDDWYNVSMKATLDAFEFMESNGVLPKLRETYFAMPDDPEWPSELNVIRKPNWFLTASDALQYNFVTKVLP